MDEITTPVSTDIRSSISNEEKKLLYSQRNGNSATNNRFAIHAI